MHVHGEELQAHSGETAARGPLQPHGEQRVGGDGQPGPPSSPVQRLDSERGSVQRPANHPEPARDGADQPVLQGLLAARRRKPRGRQSQEHKGTERTEKTSQPPASRRSDKFSRDMKS